MCQGPLLAAWQAACVRKLLAVEGVQAGLLIVPRGRPAAEPGTSPMGRELLWRAFVRRTPRERSRALRSVDATDLLSGVPRIECETYRKGRFSNYFTNEDVLRIREHHLDFVLRFAFGIIRGAILKAPRYGVWSFHHGDERTYRGGPACFWEIYNRDATTGAVLQRLTDRLDGGVVLHRGRFKTILESYPRSRDAVFLGAIDWPARVCKDLLAASPSYVDGPASSTTAPIYTRPTNRQMLVFLLRVGGRRLLRQYRLHFRGWQWNVGILRRPIHTLLADPVPAAEWLPGLGRNRFLADPFGKTEDGVLTLLVEDFDYRTRKGIISALVQENGSKFSPPERVLELPVHMSYPYLFEHGNAVYCVPETHQARQVSLFRAQPFPRQWIKVATLIEGFAAVDSTVFRHEGRWWLFCTDHDDGAPTKLHAWHAPELTGPWTPHALNPLKTDVTCSRPAGTPFVHEGRLYRPAQDCSVTYGGSVVLNEVRQLTPVVFEEVVAASITPAAGSRYAHGLHTISAVGDLTVIDGKRPVFVPAIFRRQLGARLNLKGGAGTTEDEPGDEP